MSLDNQSQPRAQFGEAGFVDRRNSSGNAPGMERRQFSDARDHLSAEAAELGAAIDQYKLEHRRRYISYEEMMTVIKSLGYEKKS